MSIADFFRPVDLRVPLLGLFLILGMNTDSHGLRMIEMSEDTKKTRSEPEMRRISLKLPLRQPALHWTFMSEEEYLAGKLTLRIVHEDDTTEVILFEDGKIAEGWKVLVLPDTPMAGEVYFGFESTIKYVTSSSDILEIELHVKKDLDGIGERRTGVLSKGIYKARGTHSKLDNEYEVSDNLNSLVPRRVLVGLQQMFEFRAVLQNWEQQWKLDISGREGWLDPE